MLSMTVKGADLNAPVLSLAVNWMSGTLQSPPPFGSPVIVHFDSQSDCVGVHITSAKPMASELTWLEGEKVPVTFAPATCANVTRIPGIGAPFGSSTVAVRVRTSAQVNRLTGSTSRTNWLSTPVE